MTREVRPCASKGGLSFNLLFRWRYKYDIWRLNVQGVVIESKTPVISVREALIAAGFNPDQGWIIVLKASDFKKQVSLTDEIDLRVPGIEKLRLTPREINNGETIASLRREFRLLSVDETGLASRGIHWETIVDKNRRWLLLRDFILPAGFSAAKVAVAIEVPPTYPAAQLDMFYCFPQLSRTDGKPIPQTQVFEMIQNDSYQRWSRHRGPSAPWRPNQDNVITHLALVEAAFLQEVEL